MSLLFCIIKWDMAARVVGFGQSVRCAPSPLVAGANDYMLGFARADDGRLATAHSWQRAAADWVRRP
jgi:hypothetical protein